MYTQYFGLSEKPFTIAPDPRYLYMSERHREALAHLLFGLQGDGCFIMLSGDIGTGKTTVCRCLLEQLPEKTDVAIILNPKLSELDLLRTICEELAISVTTEPATNKNYIDALNHHLLLSHGQGRITALLIDEAQNLDPQLLEQLRLLTNLETNTQKLLKIILVGQPELRDMLARPELAQVSQRITSRYHLQSLQAEDVHKYIQHRIQVAGGGVASLFSDQAIEMVIRLSTGVPRLINLLCDRGLLGAYAEESSQVSGAIMKKAASEVLADITAPRNVYLARLPIVAAAALLLLAGYFGYQHFAPPPAPANISTIAIQQLEQASATNSSADTAHPMTELSEAPSSAAASANDLELEEIPPVLLKKTKQKKFRAATEQKTASDSRQQVKKMAAAPTE